MRILVLGGTSFVGRAVVTAAVERGWSVTTFNRGTGSWAQPGAERVPGDRLRPADLVPLTTSNWDAVVDTWAGAPAVVLHSATALAAHAARYVYVSSRAVYALPTTAGLDESAPTVAASPDADDGEYAQNKRGAEIAVETTFGERAVLARAGLILGPHEDRGRLPYWLRRIERGGRVLAPGPPEVPVRFVDARDLAAWLLDASVAAKGRVSGPVNLVNPPGHTTMLTLLAATVAVTGSDAELVWLEPDAIAAAGVRRHIELPGWVPPDTPFAGLLWTNVDRAHATGLRCRPVEATVRDTWQWMVECGPRDLPRLGLDPDREREILATPRG